MGASYATGKLTSFKMVKFVNIPISVNNIFTESGISIYYYAGNQSITVTNSQSTDITLNWVITKKY